MHMITYILIVASTIVLASGQMQEFLKWYYVDYVWESEAVKAEAVKSGKYDYGSILPMDVDVDQSGRIFMTFLGKVGVPATLGIVTNITDKLSGPLIRPYPDWSWFNNGSCSSIQNVYRIAIDECNRLFVVDTGFLEGQIIKCQPQILIFDLTRDRHIQTIRIPKNVLKNRSGITLLANPIIETEGPYCEKTTMYMADPYSYALVVLTNNRIFRLENEAFIQNEQATKVTSGNVTHNIGGGLLGMAISPRIFSDETRLLYFRPIASYDLYTAETDDIKHNTYGANIPIEKKTNVFSSQVVTMAFSSEGTLFYGLTRENAIGCWNKFVPLETQSLDIVAQDDLRLQYLNGLKVIKPTPAHPVEELWTLSNRFTSYLEGLLGTDDINFRVLKAPVKSLISGSKCEMPSNVKILLEKYKKTRTQNRYFRSG